MNRLRRVTTLILYLATLNFVLFFYSIIILGGDSFTSGKIEAGHYFLGNHGVYTEVWFPIYIYSWLHGASAVLSWLFLIPTMLLLGLSDPCRVRIHLGRLYNGIERLFGRAFDEWRTPSVEFFTRLQPAARLARLEAALTDEDLRYYFRRSFVILTGSTEFDLISTSPGLNPGLNLGLNPLLVLHGKLTPTPQGTYVRAWHRFSVVGTLFFGMFGILLTRSLVTLLIWFVTVHVIQVDANLAQDTLEHFGIPFLVGIVSDLGGVGLAIWLGAVIGKWRHEDWGWFLEDALTRTPAPVTPFVEPTPGLSLIERLQREQPEAFAQAKRKR